MPFLPILKVNSEKIPERVLVVGDPGRLERISKELSGPAIVAENREYRTMLGVFGGIQIAVISHGVGSAGAGVCFEEICKSGAKKIIRVGTAGGMQKGVNAGEIVVARGAVREDGLSPNLVPLSFPAIASLALTSSMIEVAHKREKKVSTGILLTSDMFYPRDILGSNLSLWQKAGVKAVEMESATLFTICELQGIKSGAIVVIDGNPLDQDQGGMTTYDPHSDIVGEAMDDAISMALSSLID
jgi:uridine phosphorylase